MSSTDDDLPTPWTTRRVLILIASMVGMLVLSLVFGFFIVRITETTTLIDSVLIRQANNPKLIIAFSVTGHGEDGSYMRGYRLKFVDAIQNVALDEQFIEHAIDRIPPLPAIEYCNDEDLWLVQKPEFIQGDVGFVAHITVTNGKLSSNKTPLPAGYVLVESRGACQLKLKNKFNESFCFTATTGALIAGECPPAMTSAETYDKIKTAFILVNKTVESTRYHIYYYATDKPDPMQISVGSGGKQSLLYKLWFSTNRLSQPELDYYKTQLGPKDTLISVYTDDYLISPATLHKSAEMAIYAEYSGKQRILCFSNKGKLLWTVDDPKFVLGDKDRAIKVKLRDDLIILSSNKWVVAVGQATNAMQWSYFF